MSGNGNFITENIVSGDPKAQGYQDRIREYVREIVEKARGLLNGRAGSPHDPGGLTDGFGWASGFSPFSPFNPNGPEFT